jgi:hypothetical protein
MVVQPRQPHHGQYSACNIQNRWRCILHSGLLTIVLKARAVFLVLEKPGMAKLLAALRRTVSKLETSSVKMCYLPVPLIQQKISSLRIPVHWFPVQIGRCTDINCLAIHIEFYQHRPRYVCIISELKESRRVRAASQQNSVELRPLWTQ